MPSRIITADGAIRKPNTDTCRLHDAGAVAVAWIIALREAAPRAVEEAMRHLAARGATMTLIEGTTALEWLAPRASIMVATDPGRPWKSVALRYASSCDIVLRNRVPRPSGDLAAPPELAAANPLDCNLGDTLDAGTSEYVRRLQRLCDANEGRVSASTSAATGR